MRSLATSQQQATEQLPTATMTVGVKNTQLPVEAEVIKATAAPISLLSDLLVHPDQFFTQRDGALHRTGEYRLLVAVLQDAIIDWFRYRNASHPRGRRLFQEVSSWFTSTDQVSLFSFENICAHLGIDPDYLRRGLLEWRPSHSNQRAPSFPMAPVVRNREQLGYDEA